MKNFLMLVVVYSLFSCRGKPIKEDTSFIVPLNAENNYEAVVLAKWKQEYLPFDSTFINGAFPVVCTAEMVYHLFGVPEKTVPIPTYHNNSSLLLESNLKNGTYLIYGNTIFEK